MRNGAQSMTLYAKITFILTLAAFTALSFVEKAQACNLYFGNCGPY